MSSDTCTCIIFCWWCWYYLSNLEQIEQPTWKPGISWFKNAEHDEIILHAHSETLLYILSSFIFFFFSFIILIIDNSCILRGLLFWCYIYVVKSTPSSTTLICICFELYNQVTWLKMYHLFIQNVVCNWSNS